MIGCGAIGRTLLTYLDENPIAEVHVVLDRNVESSREFVSKLKRVRPEVTSDLKVLIESCPDIVVEAASPEAVREYVPLLVGKTRHIVIMSVSAFVDVDFFKQLLLRCRNAGTQLHVPSGAIGGVDLVKTHALHGLRRILLTTRKPPHALGLSGVSREEVLYEGSVVEAVKRYPRNVNIYATVVIASGLQLDKIWCRVVADPGVSMNVHEMEIESNLGKAFVRLENVPSELNPRTSKIAAYSLIRKITEIVDPVLDIGT